MTAAVPDPPRLFRRLEEPPLCGLLTPDDRMMIKVAYILAKAGHRWQTRKEGGRYFDHPLDAAEILLDELGIVDPVMIAAALLHDCPEDSRDITVELIAFTLANEVARLVLQVSKLPKEGYYERLHDFGEVRALLIKAVDRLSNLRSLLKTERAFIEKQVRQTKTEFMPLVDRLVEIAPPAYAKTAARVKELIVAELAALEAHLASLPA